MFVFFFPFEKILFLNKNLYSVFQFSNAGVWLYQCYTENLKKEKEKKNISNSSVLLISGSLNFNAKLKNIRCETFF